MPTIKQITLPKYILSVDQAKYIDSKMVGVKAFQVPYVSALKLATGDFLKLAQGGKLALAFQGQ